MYLENNRTHHSFFLILSAWATALITMGLIFLLSQLTQPDVAKIFTGIADFFHRLFNLSTDDTGRSAELVRKVVYGTLYLILSLLLAWALSCSGIHQVRNGIFVLLIAGLFAFSDELHQTMIAGRVGRISDLLIDFAGILVGIFIYQIGSLLYDIRTELSVRRDEAPRL